MGSGAMRYPAIPIWRATALAWLALGLAAALTAGPATQVQASQTVAQATDDEDDGQPPPRSRGPAQQEPVEEPASELQSPPRLGDSRRPDPFDANDDRPAQSPNPAAAANPDHDVVVCEAGCDGPRGEVVYKQKKQPPG